MAFITVVDKSSGDIFAALGTNNTEMTVKPTAGPSVRQSLAALPGGVLFAVPFDGWFENALGVDLLVIVLGCPH